MALQMGSKGTDVLNLQMMLYAASYYHKRPDFDPRAYDSVFGTKTFNAVRNFQAALGLTVDGIAGSQTLSALEAVNASQPGTVSFYTTGAITTPVISPLPPLPQPDGIIQSPSPLPQGGGIIQPPIDWKLIGIAGAVLFGIIFLIGDDGKKRR